jgi:hypothetical protein
MKQFSDAKRLIRESSLVVSLRTVTTFHKYMHFIGTAFITTDAALSSSCIHKQTHDLQDTETGTTNHKDSQKFQPGLASHS